jgi:hypothetical protein
MDFPQKRLALPIRRQLLSTVIRDEAVLCRA